MDDIIFERDYREAESGEYDEWCDEVFDRAVNGGMLKAYSDAMDKIPKIIIPEDKKNYEYLLERCDAFVERHRGRIEGILKRRFRASFSFMRETKTRNLSVVLRRGILRGTSN